jgi:serine/threonine protein kinase
VNTEETAIQRWRGLGFDETIAIDPADTIRSTAADRASDTAAEIQLPRISVDLPNTLRSAATLPEAGPLRAELEIRTILGEGGMGRVFLARQNSLDREVAIKTLREHASPNDRHALVHEGGVTGRLEHPSIVPVHALGLHADGRPVLVMKLVDGVSWQELLRNPDHAAWKDWGGDTRDRLDVHLEILMQVCNAAHFAHDRGILHLDIKPPNVLIGRFGDVYLADWGIAHRMDSAPRDRVCGTAAYMAPEMAMASAVDARTDVYLLGATLHEILTGRRRHEGPTVFIAMMNAILSQPVEYDATVPEELAAVANRATARIPGDRFASAAAFRRAIVDYLEHKSSVALSASASPRLAKLRELIAQRETDHRLVDELLAETRFALTRALEQWPESPSALRARDELESALASRRARAEELERIARDLDPRIAMRERTMALAGIGVAAIAVLLVAVAKGVRHQPSPRELVITSLGPLLAFAALAFVFGAKLRGSAVNRQTVVGMLIVTTAIMLSAVLAMIASVSGPVAIMFQSLTVAALLGFAGETQFPWVRWLGLVMLAAAFVSALAPPYAHFSFSLATSASILVGVYFGWRSSHGPP